MGAYVQWEHMSISHPFSYRTTFCRSGIDKTIYKTKQKQKVFLTTSEGVLVKSMILQETLFSMKLILALYHFFIDGLLLKRIRLILGRCANCDYL